MGIKDEEKQEFYKAMASCEFRDVHKINLSIALIMFAVGFAIAGVLYYFNYWR